ncbi:MAG: Gfo/Idh/MocA family oxidoreductase [Anaerolineales bacterium]|nr:Gfo/Idh/MocA family oxidoreductase [Anaerolineales bacterium]MDW8161825.1 Gfo/Idh/MocA family oxidoreductase [Anaerolineales bacterium]
MKLRMAIVGCGEIAGYVAFLARFVPRLRITACCDIDPDRASQFARRHRIPAVYSEYDALLDRELLDAVYLAVPHDLHLPMTLKAAEKGKAVLLEKPLARNTAEGQELIRRVSANKVGVNYQYRYDSAAYALARAVQKGELGEIYSIVVQVPWHRERRYFEEASWHRSLERSGGGTLLTQASHFLDWAFWALRDKPQSAMGYTASFAFAVEVETLAHGVVQTQKGTLISIVSSMVCAKEESVSIRVDGQAGSAIYREKPLLTLKFQGVKVKAEKPPLRGFHALQRSLAAFVAWILDDRPYLIPAAEALPALAAVEAIYRSAQTGKRESTIYR